MLNKIDVGWTVLFNDYWGFKCTGLVTRVYAPGDIYSDLDLHVIGMKNNEALIRGKLKVPYGVSVTGAWEYPSSREIRISNSDLLLGGEGLIHNDVNDVFEKDPVGINIGCVDGGWF